MFKSFEHLKAVAEKFSKGKIIPNRVLYSGNHKDRHKVIFGSDVYRVSTKFGSALICDKSTGCYGIKITGDIKKINLIGNKYQGTGNHWFIYKGQDENLKKLNEFIKYGEIKSDE
tara:strand:+ start:292 stop:636 length:345 start_codon:yes stop_codon:yes gene_type:complete